MPSKSANVKNEKQYEALKDKGMSKERAAKIANTKDASKKGGKQSGKGGDSEPGRHHSPEEKGGSQGRQSRCHEELGELRPGPTTGEWPDRWCAPWSWPRVVLRALLMGARGGSTRSARSPTQHLRCTRKGIGTASTAIGSKQPPRSKGERYETVPGRSKRRAVWWRSRGSRWWTGTQSGTTPWRTGWPRPARL